MMNGLQKVGGVAAPVMAATWVVGFAVFLGVLTPAGYFDEGVDPAEKVAILADNQAIVSLSYLITFVVFGILLVVLALALHERLKASSTAMAPTATAIGLIWAGLLIASGMSPTSASAESSISTAVTRRKPGRPGSFSKRWCSGWAARTRSQEACGSCSSAGQPCGQGSCPGR